MALLQSLRSNITKLGANSILKPCSARFVHNNTDGKEETEAKVMTEDMPVEMENPFVKDKPQCILCKYNIEPNFRNIRLLSQFMSPYTGRIYGRYITGLCEKKQKKVEVEIARAQNAGLMGYYSKNPNFLSDPDIYDPTKPFRAL